MFLCRRRNTDLEYCCSCFERTRLQFTVAFFAAMSDCNCAGVRFSAARALVQRAKSRKCWTGSSVSSRGSDRRRLHRTTTTITILKRRRSSHTVTRTRTVRARTRRSGRASDLRRRPRPVRTIRLERCPPSPRRKTSTSSCARRRASRSRIASSASADSA
jgi:hypothetical protein